MHIQEMTESVMNQSFQDFELIIVDDGSVDDTKKVLDAIQTEKVKIIHSEHRGPSAARNLAIQNARADIIFNLDADDRIAPDLLEKGYKIFLERKNIGIVYTECRYFGARSGIMKTGHYSLENMLRANRIVSAAFFRKEDWIACGGYSEAFLYGLEDWDLWLNIIELGREVVKIQDSSFYYRIYKDLSASRAGRRNSDRTKSLESVLLIFERHKHLIVRHPAILRRFEKLKLEKDSGKLRQVRNMVFPIRHKLACLIN
jgi:glycosyltransferase involved in cell wall biosynthesis